MYLRRSFISLSLLLLFSACSNRVVYENFETVEVKKPAAVNREVIILDAGHGGKDPGACSKKDHYEEKELTLATTLALRNYLHRLGYKTVLTRSQDEYVSLQGRSDIANSIKADVFVSVHYNYSSNNDAQGIEVYYYKENCEKPSKRIVESKNLGRSVLSQMLEQTHANSRGVKEGNFSVIRQTQMPAILIEAGFLSSPKERNKIKDPKYMHLVASSIAKGIDGYFKSRKEITRLWAEKKPPGKGK